MERHRVPLLCAEGRQRVPGQTGGHGGAHAGNNNYDSIGVCFEGSFDREEMPRAQKQAGMELVAYLKQKYGISTVQRHSDVNATGCPGGISP